MVVQQRALHAVVLNRCLLREEMEINGDSNYYYCYSIANKTSMTLCSSLGSFSSKLKVFYKISGNKCIYQPYLVIGKTEVE